jgi:prolyl oligopeptidase PreP (S9A serine peptidase family)
MQLFLKLTFLLFVLCVSPLQAASFTADAVQIRGKSVSHARMFWLDGNVRFEYTEDGVPMAQIFDNKKNKIIWLDKENKFYLEREMPDGEKIIAGKKNKKTNDPCKQFAGAECVFLKKTKMNDRDAEKWLITLSSDGNDFHIFQWIDIKYKNILRQENSDGTGLSVTIKDNQKMNERKVRKLTMTAFSASGEQKQGTQWYDNELDIVVKQEYQNNIVDELRNIKVGKVSKKLFSVPKTYTLFDTSVQTAMRLGDSLEKEKN